ncbi:hypothetical protein [Thiovibrio frasassiensis]|uniref:Uncharacterized protein n=1 Tax=Thiovibrio frasassiensis TaxID=2984131 RepID=A0A9X4RKV0_9BACT|nr:hypothetical protein [Thiovibrio frasassiensis]MDG4475401.1 hypothetical protein [Thiovibrio frasassiensis]
MTTTTETDEKLSVFATVILVLVAFFAIFILERFMSYNSRHPLEDKPKEVVHNLSWDGSVLQVESWLKQNLKDPGSFEAIEWSKVIKNANGYFVRCKYRAKNSFGGYAVENKLFMLNSSGEVITVTDVE